MRMAKRTILVMAGALSLIGSISGATAQQAEKPEPGTVKVPAFDLPYSTYASPEARKTFIDKVLADGPKPGPDIAKTRAAYAAVDEDRIVRLRKLFAVEIERSTIAGVPVQIVRPVGLKADEHRVLINLHGGGFLWGGGTGALVEAIPIAASAGLPVVAVDYRMAPEARYPAGSEDVAAVYGALLKKHAPKSIGIYGCSAGAMLTGESLVWFQRHGLPTPGAAGIFCMGASMPGGDSAYLSSVATGTPPGPMIDFTKHPYFIGADFNDAAVVPIVSDAAMAKFPPTLLISGTRDGGLSAVLATQASLARNGVEADLHVWDGMWHSFMSDPEPRESREAYRVVAKFFLSHLATGRAVSPQLSRRKEK
jgi:epsilon-lactone hydrolase